MHVIKIAACRREERIDFDALPVASKEFIINYGLKQWLNDAIVSGDNEAERNGLLDKRLDKLFEGTLAIRESGGRTTSPLYREIARMAKERAEADFRKKGLTPAKVAKADMAARIAQYKAFVPLIERAQANVAANAEVPQLEL